MNTRATVNLPNPMRMLRAWLLRERAVRGPAALELDLVERQVDREQAAVRAAAGAAAGIECRLNRVRARIREFLTDEKTPGVIDASETRVLAHDLVGASVAAHRHTEKLEALS